MTREAIKRRKRIKKVLIYVFMAILSLIFLLPIIVMISTAFKSPYELQQSYITLFPKDFTLENFIGAMTTGNWPRYIFNSVFITAVTVVCTLFLNSMAAYAFARLEFKGRDLLFAFSLIALMIPEQVIMIPVVLRLKTFPLAGGNNLFGVGGSGLLDTYAGLIVPFIAHPFGVFLTRSTFLSLPKALDEAAILDGCSRFGVFWRICLPLSKPTLVTLGLLKCVSTWNQYMWPLVLTTSEKLKTVQLALSMYTSEYSINIGYTMAAATIVVLPVLILFLCLQKYYVAGIVSSGIKG